MHQLGPENSKEVDYFRQLMIKICQLNNIEQIDLAHNYWIYSPPKELLKKHQLESKDLGKIQEELLAEYEKFSIEDFFYQNYNNKKIDMDKEIKNLAKNLENNSTAVVVLSGIFSEFIDTVPFHEIFQSKDKSSQNLLKILSIKNKVKDFNEYMPSTTMEKDGLGVKYSYLDKYIRIQNLKISLDPNEISIPILFMETPRFSFESIGDQYNVAKIYLRRLEKFINIWEKKFKNIILLGYSRGATIALEMLRLSKENKHPWANSIKGVISLGGVLYGTHLASEAMVCVQKNTCEKNDPKNAKILFALQNLANSLDYLGMSISNVSDTLHHTKILLKNSLEWIKFFASLGISVELKDLKNYKLNIKKVHEQLIDILIKTNSLRYLDMKVLNKFTSMLLFNSFHLKSFYKEYDLNIKKFKISVGKVIEAINQITIEERFRWWKKSKLPNKNISYWAITALCADVTNKKGILSQHIMNNPWTYIPNHIDDWVMRHCYERLKELSGSSLNDGQVVLPYAMFQNEINLILNPYYIRNKIKGPIPLILGVNHWGMAFPIVNPRMDKLKNNFPREEFLLSMVLYMIKDFKNSER